MGFGWRVPARAILVLLAASSLGCVIGGRNHLIGFPEVEAATPSDRADRGMEAIRLTEKLIRETDHPIVEGAPWKRAAMLRLLDAYVALSNDEIGTSTGLDPQGTISRRPPLFLYPRSTSPLIAEPAEGPGGAPQYFLTLILNRKAFERPRTAEAWLGYPIAALFVPAVDHELHQTGEALYRQLREHFHFVLVPRDSRHPEEVSLDADPDRYVPTRLAENADQTPGRMHLRKDAIEILFRLPVADLEERWKRIDTDRGAAVREELFDLRLLPRLALDPSTSSAPWRPVAEAFSKGRWSDARDLLRERVRAGGPAPSREDAAALADALSKFGEVFRHFSSPLANARRLASELAREPASKVALGSLLQAVELFLEENDCPGPVLLDRPDPARRSFSFIACGDLQYHGNGSKLFAFLAMIDPERAPRDAKDPLASPAIPRELIEEIRSAKFILLAGDFGDGEGFSSSGIAPALDGLGLIAPTSPYRDLSDPAVGEFPELREQVRRSGKAVFAVPGNHDVFASYGGILNQVVAGVGYLLQGLPLTSILGTWMTDSLSHKLPILVRLARITPPFYDGLVDWAFELGPRNVAFEFRGCAFVAPNSSDLYQADRDQVGAVANNWGGMLQDVSLAWTDLALRHFSSVDRAARGLPGRTAPAHSFLFMHQDPRGAIASKNGFVERHFGSYHTIVAPINELTLGYFGTHSNRYSGAFIPIITPIAGQLIAASGAGENFHQRWMRHTVWDESCGNARGLLEVINRNLAGAPPIRPSGAGPEYPSAGISNVFFAHDDVPIVSEWVHGPADTVFPEPPLESGSAILGSIDGLFRRPTHLGTPEWGKEMAFHDGRQATVVRMDDVGDAYDKNNTNGFHLVTVTPPPAGAPATERAKVVVRWIQIPR
ncbi:MAG TPA: hypothetical protein VFC86_14400 [Planctomycetota bacterium]|nr:hypothetical protein [Planctomycetota bacterium]